MRACASWNQGVSLLQRQKERLFQGLCVYGKALYGADGIDHERRRDAVEDALQRQRIAGGQVCQNRRALMVGWSACGTAGGG